MKCKKCLKSAPVDQFVKCNQRKSGRREICKACYNAHEKSRYQDPAVREYRLSYGRALKLREPLKHIWYEAKKRAADRGLPFNIEPSDIFVPEFCPVLGIRLVFNSGKAADNSVSLDAIVPARGYVRGNIQIISRLANAMKNKATPAQLLMFAAWVRQNVHE